MTSPALRAASRVEPQSPGVPLGRKLLVKGPGQGQRSVCPSSKLSSCPLNLSRAGVASVEARPLEDVCQFRLEARPLEEFCQFEVQALVLPAVTSRNVSLPPVPFFPGSAAFLPPRFRLCGPSPAASAGAAGGSSCHGSGKAGAVEKKVMN